MNWIAKRTMRVEKYDEKGQIVRPSWLYQRYHEDWLLQTAIADFNLDYWRRSCIY